MTIAKAFLCCNGLEVTAHRQKKQKDAEKDVRGGKWIDGNSEKCTGGEISHASL